MDEELVFEVKKKKEFSKLPDSIVERALEKCGDDIKEARAFLRKYFGIFLTNKVMKGKEMGVLRDHKSSMKRDYEKFYGEIFRRGCKVNSVIDLGSGVNGFSYEYLKEILGDVEYFGIEASGQLVENVNEYFEETGLKKYCQTVCGDIFDLKNVVRILRKAGKPRVVFMFQVIDALEIVERNFSKKYLLEIMKDCEKLVLSLPVEIFSGRRSFAVKRNWIEGFLKEMFIIEKDFEMNGERVFVVGKK